MASVIKDIGEIWTRLFDHRPFIQGEVTYFLREFQDKREDREAQRLNKILEYTNDLGQNQLNRAEQLGDSHLPGLKNNLDLALNLCNRVLEKENKCGTNDKLEINKELRKNEWEKFISDINEKYIIVDQELENNEKELRNFYADLEKKLHITS